jgi:beta-lactamase class C
MKTRRIYFIVITLTILIILGFLTLKPVRYHESQIDKIQEPLVDSSPQRRLIDNYELFIANAFDSTHTVGAALAVVYDGRLILKKTYGVKEIGTYDSINDHTVFRVASVSKGFAGVLACLLEQQSLLNLEENIHKLIPGFRLRDSVNTNNLNISHLLSQTTGLVPHAFDNLIEDGVSFPLVLQELPTVEISAEPGKLYSYQNVIFSLFDSIVYVKTGSPYGVMLAKKIFRPLKMRDASTNPDIFTKKRSNAAMPHTLRNSLAIRLPANIGYYNLIPAAGVNASISDMSKWLFALLGYRPDVLDSSLLEIIETPFIESPLSRRYLRRWDHIDSKYYSLGWRIYYYKGRKIIYHGGFVSGYRAEIAFCPEEKVGIVFMENSPNELASISVPEFFNRWIAASDSSFRNIK